MKTKTKMIIATVVAVMFCIANGSAQSFGLLWQKHYTANTQNDSIMDVNVSTDGNVYVCGRHGVSATQSDAYITSYTFAGVENTGWPHLNSWVFQGINDYKAVEARVISPTVTEIYAVGEVYTSTLPLQDMFIAKYNKNGTLAWEAQADNSNSETALAVAVDQSNGDVYVGGRSTSNAGDIMVTKLNIFGSLQVGWPVIYNTGTVDNVFTNMKLNGSLLWVTGYNKVTPGTNHDVVLIKITTATGANTVTTWDNTASNDRDEAYAADVDATGNVYLAGTTKPGTTQDALLLKFNSSGAFQCATAWNAPAALGDELRSIDVVSTSEIYVTGFTQATGTNNSNYLTMKFNGTSCATMATPTWNQTFDGTGSGAPVANDDIAYQVLVSSTSGKVFVTGRSYQSTGGFNATTVRYSTTGTQETSFSYDRSSLDNSGAYKYPMDLQTDGCYGPLNDHIYIAGWSMENATFKDATLVKYGYSGPCIEGPGGEGRMMTSGTSTGEAKIYPNPFNGKTTFSSGTETIYSNASFIVFDMMGKEVKRMENINAFEFEIDMNGFASGLYFYRYIGNETILSSGKFVIQD